MKFLYNIVDCDDGTVEGTNDLDVARKFMEDDHDRYIIIYNQTGTFFDGSTDENEIEWVMVGPGGESLKEEDDDQEQDDDSGS